MLTSELKKNLRDKGYRLTPQRAQILEIVHAAKTHLSAEDIYAQMQVLSPEVSLSTIYRTLELLTELDLMTPIQTGDGFTRFHFVHEDEQSHHHLICKRCGGETDVPEDVFQSIVIRLREEYGFQAHLVHFGIPGICSYCLNNPRLPKIK